MNRRCSSLASACSSSTYEFGSAKHRERALSNNVGGVPGLELLLQQQLLLLYLEGEQEHEEQETIVRGVSWLCDPLSKPKVDRCGAPPEVGTWTCPRCRSHRCIRVNPGNTRDPVYCCSVCGYTFRKASATRLPDPAK